MAKLIKHVMDAQLRAFNDFWSMGLMLIRGAIAVRAFSPDDSDNVQRTDPLNAALNELTVNYLLLERLRRETILTEMRSRELLTNDYVTLSGGLQRGTSRTLQVNGLPPVSLDRKEFLVMLILASPGLDPFLTLDETRHRGYVPLEKILKRVEVAKNRWLEKMSGGKEDFWVFPNDEDVRKIVWQVRGKLEENDGNRNLIQTGNQHVGYRFSCPRRHITVELTGAGAEALRGI
ncbi:MAG: hypothetical protein GWP08_11655 [Nitrospiraceae bacterium]|nr:hypothetical protein [Nitrospiraceae bacterium]